MSERASIRAIAKARLEAMNVPHVNKVLGMGMRHSMERKLQATRFGRDILARIQEEHVPVWRRVTNGSLAKDGYRAQMGFAKKKYTIAR